MQSQGLNNQFIPQIFGVKNLPRCTHGFTVLWGYRATWASKLLFQSLILLFRLDILFFSCLLAISQRKSINNLPSKDFQFRSLVSFCLLCYFFSHKEKYFFFYMAGLPSVTPRITKAFLCPFLQSGMTHLRLQFSFHLTSFSYPIPSPLRRLVGK